WIIGAVIKRPPKQSCAHLLQKATNKEWQDLMEIASVGILNWGAIILVSQRRGGGRWASFFMSMCKHFAIFNPKKSIDEQRYLRSAGL
ncbi:MAG: hypothetical protein WCF95_07750, partial [bacterium]